MAEKMVIVYNLKTGAGISIPQSHIDNYVGKGYSETAPKKNEEKES